MIKEPAEYIDDFIHIENGQKMLEIATNWTYRSVSAVINEPAEYIVHFIHIKSVK